MGAPNPPLNVVVAITHANFDPARRATLEVVLQALDREGVPRSRRFLQADVNRQGSLWCFREAMRYLTRISRSEGHDFGDITHVLRLADDTPPLPGFGLLVPWLAGLDLARPGPIDLIVNTDHPEIAKLAGRVYKDTDSVVYDDGLTKPALYVSADGGCVGATLWPVALLRAYLDWRDRWLPDTVADDRGANLWSIAEDVPIYKPVRSLVDHLRSVRLPDEERFDAPPEPGAVLKIPSLDGHDGDAHREPLHPMALAVAERWARTPSGGVTCARIGRTYANIQRELFWERRGFREARARAALRFAADEMVRATGDAADGLPIVAALMNLDAVPAERYVSAVEYLTPALVDRVYRAERHGADLDPKGVAIACPSYRGLRCEVALAMQVAEAHLRKAGYRVSYILTPGASLVTRARHRIQHLFMASDCSYLFQWDDDVVPLDPSVVLRMIETGHPIVAGAYPLRGRDASAVAANPFVTADGQPMLKVDPDGTAAVRDAATGFLLVRREVLADLMARHPERLYVDTAHGEFRFAPMWDIFGTFVDPGEPAGSEGAKGDPQAPPFPTYRSEDYGFCTLARAAGYEVRVVVDARFDHHGDAVYRGSAAEAWLTKGTRLSDAEMERVTKR